MFERQLLADFVEFAGHLPDLGTALPGALLALSLGAFQASAADGVFEEGSRGKCGKSYQRCEGGDHASLHCAHQPITVAS